MQQIKQEMKKELKEGLDKFESRSKETDNYMQGLHRDVNYFMNNKGTDKKDLGSDILAMKKHIEGLQLNIKQLLEQDDYLSLMISCHLEFNHL